MRQFNAGADFFVEHSFRRDRRGICYRSQLSPDSGNGGFELRQFQGGLSVGRMDYQLSRPYESTYLNYEAPLGFSLVLSGGFAMQIPKIGFNAGIRKGEMFLCTGRFDHIHSVLPSGQVIRGVSLELSGEMVEDWCAEGTGRLDKFLAGLLKKPRPLLVPYHIGSQPFSRIASRLLSMRTDTVGEDLLLESLGLELLANILSLDFSSGSALTRMGERRWAAIDEAVDILGREWADPPTISILARRVGLNACYLKSGFRHRTGLTIGEYVRKQRMEAALKMLESDECSVLQAALGVGYSNPSHFSEAFKQFYGRLPSSYRQRSAFPV